MWTGPILESKGMLAVFQKKDNKKKRKEKGQERVKYLKIWPKLYKISKYFEKGQVVACDYHTQ